MIEDVTYHDKDHINAEHDRIALRASTPSQAKGWRRGVCKPAQKLF
jgi:hypothetical protein